MKDSFVVELWDFFRADKNTTALVGILICLPLYLMLKFFRVFGLVTKNPYRSGKDLGE